MDSNILSPEILLAPHENISNFSSQADVALLNTSHSDEDLVETSTVVRRHLAFSNQVIITFFYIFGIAGNFAALRIIAKNETKRYQKQTLMLKSLALNDLTALLGSFILMYVNLYMPTADARWLCATRVIWRAFGLGSGCVAFVMALERWLALSHPFTYQKHITQAVIRCSIVGLWMFNALLVCAPFVGFGLWYDENRPQKPCVRYRFGATVADKTYAYCVFTFGMFICITIVCCNLSVIRVLCRMGSRMIARRYSRASCRSSSSKTEPSYNHATPEELSFAKLMAVLSIFFVICWAPQLLAIIAAQHSLLESNSQIYRAADILIALNFTLDPYLYVLFRRHQLCGKRNLKKLGKVIGSNRQSNSTPKNLLNTTSVPSSNGGKSNSVAITRTTERQSSKSTKSEKEYVPLKLLLNQEYS